MIKAKQDLRMRSITTCLILGLCSIAPLNAWAKRDAIVRPAMLFSDEERLGYLISLKERLPTLFSEAATYDIDLLDFVEKQNDAWSLLSRKHREFVRLHENKKYFEFRISPPPGGFVYSEKMIQPKAVQEWKDDLLKTFNLVSPHLATSTLASQIQSEGGLIDFDTWIKGQNAELVTSLKAAGKIRTRSGEINLLQRFNSAGDINYTSRLYGLGAILAQFPDLNPQVHEELVTLVENELRTSLGDRHVSRDERRKRQIEVDKRILGFFQALLSKKKGKPESTTKSIVLSQAEKVTVQTIYDAFTKVGKATFEEKVRNFQEDLQQLRASSDSESTQMALSSLSRGVDNILESIEQKQEIQKHKLKLAQLQVALEGKGKSDVRNIAELRATIESLTDGDLVTHSDKDFIISHLASVSPSVAPGTAPGSVDDTHAYISNAVSKMNQTYSNQTLSEEKKFNQEVTLTQVIPSVGVFRGIAGSDCSSQRSMPYPNDPHELIFLIEIGKGGGKGKEIKGYVNATVVEYNDHGTIKKGLYVITINGNKVTAGQTEVILRSLEKKKAELGVDEVLLPVAQNVDPVINFPGIRGVFHHYVDGKSSVPIQYLNPEIRKTIQEIKSFNSVSYDYMERNTAAVVFRSAEFRSSETSEEPVLESKAGSGSFLSERRELGIQMTEFEPEAVLPKREADISPTEVLDFILDLKRSNREAQFRKIKYMGFVLKTFPIVKLESFLSLLIKCQDERFRKVTLEEMKSKLVEYLRGFGIPEAEMYFEKKEEFLYPGFINCEGGLNTENLEKVGTALIKDMNKSPNFLPTLLQFTDPAIATVLPQIYNTQAFKDFFKFHRERLQLGDLEEKKESIVALTNTKAVDSVTENILLPLLSDTDSKLRQYTLWAFGKSKTSNPIIRHRIVQSLIDSNEKVREDAVRALQDLAPLDESLQDEVFKIFHEQTEPEVRDHALKAIAAIKANKPSILTELEKEIPRSIKVDNLIFLAEIFKDMPTLTPKVLDRLIEIGRDPLQTVEVLETLERLTSLVPSPVIDSPTSLALQLRLMDAIKIKDQPDFNYYSKILKSLKPTNRLVIMQCIDLLETLPTRDHRRQIKEVLKASDLTNAQLQNSLLFRLGFARTPESAQSLVRALKQIEKLDFEVCENLSKKIKDHHAKSLYFQEIFEHALKKKDKNCTYDLESELINWVTVGNDPVLVGFALEMLMKGVLTASTSTELQRSLFPADESTTKKISKHNVLVRLLRNRDPSVSGRAAHALSILNLNQREMILPLIHAFREGDLSEAAKAQLSPLIKRWIGDEANQKQLNEMAPSTCQEKIEGILREDSERLYETIRELSRLLPTE